MRRPFALAVVALASSCASTNEIRLGDPMVFAPDACADVKRICNTPAAKLTSVVALLGNPHAWNGKAVAVDGFIDYDTHGTMLFMSTEHCLAWNAQYAVQ